MVKHLHGLFSTLDASMPSLLEQRAARIRLVLTDCDGTLTDGGVYYDKHGEALKRFSIRDGMGIQLLREQGIACGIMSGERSESIIRRAEKLNLQHVYLGVKNKEAYLDEVLASTGIPLDAVAYIGDDVNDLGILSRVREIGLTAAPTDAVPSVLRIVHYVCETSGGHGAFREFVDWLLKLRTSAGNGGPQTHIQEEPRHAHPGHPHRQPNPR